MTHENGPNENAYASAVLTLSAHLEIVTDQVESESLEKRDSPETCTDTNWNNKTKRRNLKRRDSL